MYLKPALPYDKIGGPFIPPDRLELIRQHFSPLSFKGPGHKTRAARFALVGIFGSGIKVAVAGTTILPERRVKRIRAGAVPVFYMLAFRGGDTPIKNYSSIFFAFQRTHPRPAVSKFNISNTY